ncbi:MAG: nitrite reductase small subunit NirD [Thiotrichales bacterium]|nr:nitrite reductase small subunit NirD [Thiotrichales bacterium]
MSEFVEVCSVDQLVKNAGVAALINETQVALYYINNEVYALNNYDPIGKAFVMSRGMIGDLKGELMVAAPLQKQHYSLKTGQCLDVEGVSIPAYQTKLENGRVFVKL